MDFYDPGKKVEATRHKLPHWRQGTCPTSITFRLADSLPKEKLEHWRAQRDRWLVEHPQPWTTADEAEHHRRFTHQIQRWLDAGHGSCVLRAPRIASIVADTLRLEEGQTHVLWAWVVMPNHVHVLSSHLPSSQLSRILKKWKGASARDINRALHMAGRLWQPDYFDRLVRSRAHFMTCLNYVRDNPARAKLEEGEFLRWERPGLRELLECESMERGLQSASQEAADRSGGKGAD